MDEVVKFVLQGAFNYLYVYLYKIMLDLMYDFVIPCNFPDIRSGYLFPRICKNNLTSLRNSARGVTTYRKTFVEV